MKIIKETSFTQGWDYKGWGRIFVQSSDAKKKIIEIINDMDPYEFENYFDEKIIGINSSLDYWEDTSLVYVGKFSINLKELTKRCKDADIRVEIINTHDEHVSDLRDIYGWGSKFLWDDPEFQSTLIVKYRDNEI